MPITVSNATLVADMQKLSQIKIEGFRFAICDILIFVFEPHHDFKAHGVHV